MMPPRSPQWTPYLPPVRELLGHERLRDIVSAMPDTTHVVAVAVGALLLLIGLFMLRSRSKRAPAEAEFEAPREIAKRPPKEAKATPEVKEERDVPEDIPVSAPPTPTPPPEPAATFPPVDDAPAVDDATEIHAIPPSLSEDIAADDGLQADVTSSTPTDAQPGSARPPLRSYRPSRGSLPSRRRRRSAS
jgi:hypothetical protein